MWNGQMNRLYILIACENPEFPSFCWIWIHSNYSKRNQCVFVLHVCDCFNSIKCLFLTESIDLYLIIVFVRFYYVNSRVIQQIKHFHCVSRQKWKFDISINWFQHSIFLLCSTGNVRAVKTLSTIQPKLSNRQKFICK